MRLSAPGRMRKQSIWVAASLILALVLSTSAPESVQTPFFPSGGGTSVPAEIGDLEPAEFVARLPDAQARRLLLE